MTTDDADGITRYNLDDDGIGDDLPARSYWWSMHRPETYAIVALAIGLVTLMSLAPAQELGQALFIIGQTPNSEQDFLITLSGARLGVGLLGIFAAVLSIRSEDADSSWSPPVARAGLLLAVLGVLLSAATIIATLASGSPDNPNF